MPKFKTIQFKEDDLEYIRGVSALYAKRFGVKLSDRNLVMQAISEYEKRLKIRF